MTAVDRLWYSRNPLAWLLLPLSLVFCTIAGLRRRLYRAGLLKPVSVGAPVIVVGNITVGGTGKTPLIIALCELLRQQGLRPGVVSRGYGAAIDGVHDVKHDDRAGDCGDEPLLIRVRSDCPVVAGRDRAAAAQTLLANHDCDVVLSDDGMQHYRLARDLEIAVVDGSRGFGNGFCLPAGPLRERPSRLASVDIVAWSGTESAACSFRLQMRDAVNLQSGERRPLEAFREQRVHALAGIGDPERFFRQLEAAGLKVARHPFPDHHRFRHTDLPLDAEAVLMTEKDAVKCRQFQDRASMDRCWSVPVDAVLNPLLRSTITERVTQVLGGVAS